MDNSLYDEDSKTYRQFDPDCAIAQSWQRLFTGKNIKPHDITLINHEKLEMQIKRDNPGISHDEAHAKAKKFIIMKMRLMRIMVVLKNINKNIENHTISAKYYPGGVHEPGYIVVNYESGETIKLDRAENDQSGMFAYHAKKQLLRVSALDVTPKESKTIWY